MPDDKPFTGPINTFLENLFAPLGKPIGRMFGAGAGAMSDLVSPQYSDIWRQKATQFGEGLPRLAADITAYGAKKHPLARLAGLGDVALRAYSQPGADVGSAIAETGAFVAAPVIGSRVSKMVEPLAQRASQAISSPGASYLAGEAVRRTASTVGGYSPFEMVDALESYRRGQPYQPFTPEHVIGTLANVLPFEAMHVPRIAGEFRRAISPLVNQVPFSEQGENWRVHWNAHDEDRQMDFPSQDMAQNFSDQLRKVMGVEPQVEMAGTVMRQGVRHEMAFKPQDLQAGFGLGVSELINEMVPDKKVPGQQWMGTIKNRVPKSEWDVLATAGIGEFLKQPRDPEELAQWIDENKPVRVEVRKLTSGLDYGQTNERASIIHELDTKYLGWQNRNLGEFGRTQYNKPEVQDLLKRLDALGEANVNQTNWQSVSPKPESEMQGYVEGAVVVHGKGTGVFREGEVTGEQRAREGGPLFYSSHSFPPNTLGWFRGYMETAKDGKKVFHIVEVQSDWAKQVRRNKEVAAEPEQPPGIAANYGRDTARRMLKEQEHSLLPQWERLVLKAAIDHAIKEGADRIAVSDAETAMMTEGHDLAATKIKPVDVDWLLKKEKQYITNEKPERLLKQWFGPDWRLGKYVEFGGEPYRVDDPQKNFGKSVSFRGQSTVDIAKELQPYMDVGGTKIPQEKGMRLHYDQILPQELRKLTGEKGGKEEFGDHNMAFVGDDPSKPLGGDANIQPRSNLIFRNPDGTPKTTSSALSFDLTKTKRELAKRGGFPLFGSEKFVKDHVQRMITEGYDPDQIASAVENVKMLQPLKGETPLQTLARSVGIDPQLFRHMSPGEALPRAFEFLTSHLHYNFGYAQDEAAQLAKRIMVPLARFAPFLKQTAFAIAPGDQRTSEYYGTQNPGSETFQNLISVLNIPKSGLSTRSTETQLFETTLILGHESTHNMIAEALNPIGNVDPKDRRAVIKALVASEAIPPDLRRGVVEQFLKLVTPKSRWPELSKVNMDRYKNSPQEMIADIGGILASGTVDKRTLRNMQDSLTFGDRASQEFAGAVYKDLTTIWSSVRDFMKTFWSDQMGTGVGRQVSKQVDTIYNNLTKLMTTREEAERTLDGFHALAERLSSGPLDRPSVVSAKQMTQFFSQLDNLDNAVSGVLRVLPTHHREAKNIIETALSWARPSEADKEFAGERLSFWKDRLKPMSQLVESLRDKVPSVIPVKALAFDYRGMVSNMLADTWKLWAKERAPGEQPGYFEQLLGGISDWQRLKWLGKDQSAQERAFSSIALTENWRTEKEGATELLDRVGREKLSPHYKGLTTEEKDKVDRSLDQFWSMMRLLAKRRHDAHRDRVVDNMTKIIMSFDKDLYSDKAYPLAQEAVAATFDRPHDLEEMQTYFNNRERVFANLPISDEGKKQLQIAIEKNLEPWQKLGDRLLGPEEAVKDDQGQLVMPLRYERPGRLAYLPEVRVREWHLAWEDQKEVHHEAFKTKAIAEKRLAEIRALKNKGVVKWYKDFNRKDRTERFRGAVQEEISSAQQDALDALKGSVLAAISRDHPEATDIVRRIERDFQPATAFAQVTVSPYMREREFVAGREDLNMVEGAVRYINATAYDIAKRHVKQQANTVLFNPDMRENPAIRNEFENYLHFVTDAEGPEFNGLKNLIFFNYLGLNPVQILVEPTQQLVTLAPYMVEQGMGIGQAYGAIRKANLDLMESYAKNTGLKNPVTQKALQEAIDKRTIDTGLASDIYGETDMDFAMQRSMFDGNDKMQDKLDLLRRPLYQLLAFARHVYGRTTPAHNGRVAFITAFEHKYDPAKQNYVEAHRFATQATDATMFGGGRAGRPMAIQGFGKASGVGGIMYSLQSYTLSTIAMMMRLSKKSIKDTLKNPTEISAATKAAGLMWGTQLALGGALGLPFVATGLALLDQIFGVDMHKQIREAFVNLAGDDEDMGHQVADGAMRGVMNLSPVDFGSRFQLGNLLGVSPYDGFSWANLVGPSANMLANYGKALTLTSQGHYEEAARTAAPGSVRNIMQLVHDDWAVRDKAGRLVDTLSTPEKIAAFAGFKSKKLTNYYEESAIRERTEANQTRVVRDIRTDAAKLLVQGDTDGARTRILQGQREAGAYDPIGMAREATQLAVEMQSPVQRRHGTRALAEQEAEISRLYPQTVSISEVQRVLRQRALMQQMGLQFGKPSLEELRTASIVDRLMQENPKLTIAQARLRAEQMTSPGARRRSSISSLLQGQQ